MSSDTHLPGIENIEAHADFVRALARSLILDSNRADDIAQETLLVALSRSPSGVRSPRAWLTTVARNLMRRGFRSDRRRSEREEAAARPDTGPDASDLAARLETTERLVRAVRELREPFRETVVLRFFEGQTPEEIATRKGVPSSTVRGRLSRALATLRERLDDEHGNDRKTWSLALLPLALPSGRTAGGVAAVGGAAAVLGGLVMSGKKIAAVAGIVVALSVGGAILLSRPSSPVVPDRDQEEVAGLLAGEAVADAEPEDVPPAAAEVATPAARDWPIKVKTNVPGAEVSVSVTYYGGEPDPAPLVTRANADGLAGFDLPDREDPLYEANATATAEGYQPATAKIENGSAVLELIPGLPLRGRVMDEDGHPVEGATVISAGRHTYSDEEGRFAVYVQEDTGAFYHEKLERFSVEARHTSFLNATVDGVGLLDEPVIVLSRGRTVSGRILGENGRPLPGLWIKSSSGPDRTRTAEDGSFLISAIRKEDRSLQVALGPRHMGEYPGGGIVASIDITGKKDVTWNAGRICIVKVHVQDEEGRPFRHATLLAKDRPGAGWGGPVTGDSGPEGEAVFSAGQARRVEVTAAAPGRMPVTEAIEFGEDQILGEVTLVLRRAERTGSLALTVRTADGGTPTHTFLSLSQGEMVVPGYNGRKIDLDDEGRAVIAELPPGNYRATVAGTVGFSTEGYVMWAGENIRVEAGSEVSRRFEIPIGGRVRVTVTNQKGEVVIPPWSVHLKNEKGWLMTGTLGWLNPRSGGLGSPPKPGPVETMSPVKPCSCFVVIERGNRVVGRSPVEVLPGKTVEVTVAIDD